MSKLERITVTMPEEMAAKLRAAVDSGEYATTSEVVREALRLMRQRDARPEQQTVELRRAVEAGVHELEQGQAIEWDDCGLRQFFDDIKSRGRQRLARRK